MTTVKFGDIWRMGSHRLLCGDSTEEAMVNAFLDGYKPKVGVTDPPYGINYKSRSKNENLYRLKLKNDHVISWSSAFRLSNVDALYIWFSFKHYDIVSRAILDARYQIKQMVVWKKPHFSLQRHLYHLQHEQCLVCVHDEARMDQIWCGDRRQVSVWEAPSVKPKDRIHPTEKPIEIYATPILNHTKEGDIALDLFAGSGAIFAAAEEIGRVGFGIELCPEACARILLRMKNQGCPISLERNLFS